ncbi:hypothetical protein K431DRAFT_279571 [Polychaeton citri CBS 116435]|uniref:Zn(2)-C6 fungal-type domain-containing protein n=1 Tax=Polychaeton citri CBS 116435 TaxID=1314669 RepID=A0A9P4PYH3_9PEZI|nr:hypothetical protein K431DRAFT_279571 [Polychaeton citri CBS 116435]
MKEATSLRSVRRRAANACTRCRQHKVKCRGGFPCEKCIKKKLACVPSDKVDKVLVTRSFISELEEKVSFYERNEKGAEDAGSLHSAPEHPRSLPSHDDEANSDGTDEGSLDRTYHELAISPQQSSSHRSPTLSLSNSLMNPLAHGGTAYISDASGTPVYLGTSSNWSFGRRVLAMSHEQILGSPLPPDDLLYQSETYDLGWDGIRSTLNPSDLDPTILPTADYAIYLINAVKFHCGQMFHLFDEESFMASFTHFHSPSADKSQLKPLWHVHYLLVLAFGKSFLTRMGNRRRPAGTELFVQAMKLLPDVIYLYKFPVDAIEILCCAALYLQSLDFRSPAYQLIGQALRVALEHGINADVQSQHIPDALAQRFRKIWWTVYILDRQISSSMGVPTSIRDKDITTRLPYSTERTQRAMAFEVQVRISRISAQIADNCYGPEGRLNVQYMLNTKAALRDVANVTDSLNQSFNLFADRGMAGISRLSAYLHILYHQCTILATRPLLFIFLEAKLHDHDMVQRGYGHVRALLQICIDSSLQTLKILAALQDQGLLESFLSFDLDAWFTSTIVLVMATVVDLSLLKGESNWLERAYSIVDEMESRGNLVAGFVKSELRQLEMILMRVTPRCPQEGSSAAPCQDTYTAPTIENHGQVVDEMYDATLPHLVDGVESGWQYTMTTEQLMMVVDSLDCEEVDWPSL